MNRNDLFNAMEFIDEKIIEKSEGKNTVKYQSKITRKTIILVAVLCALTVMSTVVFATKLFGETAEGLRDTLVSSTVSASDNSTESVITLAGFSGSPEYMAASEWKAFKESYDPDGIILNQSGNVDVNEKYVPYGAYTQDMINKIDEIAKKYKLTLHSGYKTVLSKDWKTVVGDFVINDNNTPYSGYVYENGTLRYDGFFKATSGMVMDYQFSRSMKGVFDPVFLNIGNIDDYSEQEITTNSGHTAVMAISEYKSVLIVDFDSCFMCINVFGGKGTGITTGDLEELVNSFDYSVLNVK